MDPTLQFIAQRVLGKAPDYAVPISIAVELAAFFATNPKDISFRLSLYPGGMNRGFGVISCREDVCGADFVLRPSDRQPDGGKASGCGALDVYKAHCDTSIGHIASRNARLARVKNAGDDSRKLEAAAVYQFAIAEKVASNRKLNPVAPALPKPNRSIYKSIADIKPNAATLSAARPATRKPDIIMIDSDDDEIDVKPYLPAKRSANPVIYSDEDKKPEKKPRVFDPRTGILHDQVNGHAHPAAPAPPNPTYDRLYIDTGRSLRQTRALLENLRVVPNVSRSDVFYREWDAATSRERSLLTNLASFKAKWGNPTVVALTMEGYEKRMSDLGADGKWNAALANNLAIVRRVNAGAQDPMLAIMNGIAAGQIAPQVGWGGNEMANGAGGDIAPHESDNEDHDPHNVDFNAFLLAAAEGDAFEGNTTVEKARVKLKLAANNVLDGMVISLLPHQIIGVDWMCTAEHSLTYGGILGDEMGLGKTVQAIGLMCLNASSDKREKTNLIVAPLALLQQWKDEIESKCVAGKFKCLIYHGPTKTAFHKELKRKSTRVNDGFAKYDVVLTTYSTLSLEWPDEESLLKKAKKERAVRRKKEGLAPAGDEDGDPEFDAKEQGALFDMSWYRIVLDEAQGIRNRNTRISRAVGHLDSLFRWCLTGTPITNSLADVFPLLRFCQIKPWYTFTKFSEHILAHEKRAPELAGRKCQTILRRYMLRRKKDSELDGRKLITLPEKHVELRVLEFSPEERDIYEFVETRTQAKFNKFLQAGTVLKNYAHVLVLLLRLRQLTCHPSLITEGFDALAVRQEGEAELARAIKVIGQVKVDKIKADRLALAFKRIKAEKENRDAVDDDDGCPVCMEPEGEDEKGSVITRCGHTFCLSCIDAVIRGAPVEPDEGDVHAPKYAQDERPCPTCRGPVSSEFLFKAIGFDPTDEELDEAIGAPEVEEKEVEKVGYEDGDDDMPVMRKMKRKQIADSEDEEEEAKPVKAVKDVKGKGKVKAKKEEEEDAKPDNWMKVQEPSTKMKWLCEEIERCAIEAPEDKFLVLCNFTTMLTIVDDYLSNKGIRSTRYQGDMSRTARDESLKRFASKKNIKVLLMSLKCGGVGLNIVCANRVINLDLAWSHAVEDQAFSRVHRLGQHKEVYIDRLTINNTVEQRIGEMQERKKALADASLGEGKGEKLGKLSVGDIAALFGLDQNGRRIAKRPPVGPRADPPFHDANDGQEG